MIVNFIYILSILPVLMISKMQCVVYSAKIVGKLSYKMSIPITRKMLMTATNIIRENQTDVQCLITNKDKKIFIHCMNSVSRSVTLVLYFNVL